jgi:peptidoglycan/LPS O-acetylase OafA/YrhL
VATDSPPSPSLDWAVLLPVICVACGWFLMASLITDVGFMQLQFHFYNVLTLMHSPGRIATGIRGDGPTLEGWLFGTLCVAAIIAALAPLFSRRRDAWLGCVAPLALMALCAAVLYHGLSQDLITDNGSLGDTGSRLIHFANSFVSSVGNRVARQVHVGAGGYLSLAASAFLAVRGLRGYQRAS